jgi:hypothetical protein
MPRDLCGEGPRFTGHGHSQTCGVAARACICCWRNAANDVDSATECARWSKWRRQVLEQDPTTW